MAMLNNQRVLYRYLVKMKVFHSCVELPEAKPRCQCYLISLHMFIVAFWHPLMIWCSKQSHGCCLNDSTKKTIQYIPRTCGIGIYHRSKWAMPSKFRFGERLISTTAQHSVARFAAPCRRLRDSLRSAVGGCGAEAAEVGDVGPGAASSEVHQGWPLGCTRYPLVKIQKTMENHHALNG